MNKGWSIYEHLLTHFGTKQTAPYLEFQKYALLDLIFVSFSQWPTLQADAVPSEPPGEFASKSKWI